MKFILNKIYNFSLRSHGSQQPLISCICADNLKLRSLVNISNRRNIRTVSKLKEIKHQKKLKTDFPANEDASKESYKLGQPDKLKIEHDDYKVFDGKRYHIYNTILKQENSHDYYKKRWMAKQRFRFWTEKLSEMKLSDLSVAASTLIDQNVLNKIDENPTLYNPADEKETIQYPFLIRSEYKNIPSEKKEFPTEHASDILSSSGMTPDQLTKLMERYKTSEDEELSAKEEFDMLVFQQARYGTPNPNIPGSDIPCSGCGALLHCQDPGLAGYMPSEIFRKASKADLRHLVCQRCHFLAKHNIALAVNVSQNNYAELLAEIRHKVALIILIIDLTDFPCSIWPGLLDIIGKDKPIFVVGNKVDLLPKDEKRYLQRIKSAVQNSLTETKLDTGNNIQGISLISAKTRYGIEDLITKLQTTWKYKGDVYLIGSTNVGKSSLFNALVESDFCKSQAVDIVHRATVSQWPGTTLNLLKFPILRPNPTRLYLRQQRIMKLNSLLKEENELRKHKLQETKDPKYATLIGQVQFTFFTPESAFPRGINNPFEMEANTLPTVINEKGKAFNPAAKEFLLSKWCYDTPGSVHPDQLINLLTLKELQLTLPKELIKPMTYCMKPKFTFFLAALGRIDFIEGFETIRITVFASSKLPVTIIPTEIADKFYQKYLGTEVFKVPCGNEERLNDFPPLVGKELKVSGLDEEESCADIVLSSAGWVSVTPRRDKECILKAYTPAGKGIHVRVPSMLPFAVRLRGERKKYTPCYKNDRICI